MFGGFAQGSGANSGATERQDRNAATNASANTVGKTGKSFLLGALLVLGMMFLQGPMLKGVFYQAAGIKAPVSTIAWRKDFDAARVEAKANDKPLLLVFSASWCPPCTAMKHDVWPDAKVSEAVKNGFVPLHIDVDDHRNSDVVARYEIRGIPAVLIVDAQGKVLRQRSFMSRSETLKFLDVKAS